MAHGADIPPQPGAAETGKGRHAIAQVGLIGFDCPLARRPRAMDRCRRALHEMAPHGLPVATDLPRDAADAGAFSGHSNRWRGLSNFFKSWIKTISLSPFSCTPCLVIAGTRPVIRGAANFRIHEVCKIAATARDWGNFERRFLGRLRTAVTIVGPAEQ
ncbi:hypothetical protein [Mangrovicoccus sp. HB161399]|uniref:hypothetical protein n=1 Tax=Mangrovicoccus sp. HB161399 TaxID=2720392 RepID=UPI001C12D3D6|nr:hypothetical protein [Mangrovicoccus sp. HB161399]